MGLQRLLIWLLQFYVGYETHGFVRGGSQIQIIDCSHFCLYFKFIPMNILFMLARNPPRLSRLVALRPPLERGLLSHTTIVCTSSLLQFTQALKPNANLAFLHKQLSCAGLQDCASAMYSSLGVCGPTHTNAGCELHPIDHVHARQTCIPCTQSPWETGHITSRNLWVHRSRDSEGSKLVIAIMLYELTNVVQMMGMYHAGACHHERYTRLWSDAGVHLKPHHITTVPHGWDCVLNDVYALAMRANAHKWLHPPSFPTGCFDSVQAIVHLPHFVLTQTRILCVRSTFLVRLPTSLWPSFLVGKPQVHFLWHGLCLQLARSPSLRYALVAFELRSFWAFHLMVPAWFEPANCRLSPVDQYALTLRRAVLKRWGSGGVRICCGGHISRPSICPAHGPCRSGVSEGRW